MTEIQQLSKKSAQGENLGKIIIRETTWEAAPRVRKQLAALVRAFEDAQQMSDCHTGNAGERWRCSGLDDLPRMKPLQWRGEVKHCVRDSAAQSGSDR